MVPVAARFGSERVPLATLASSQPPRAGDITAAVDATSYLINPTSPRRVARRREDHNAVQQRHFLAIPFNGRPLGLALLDCLDDNADTALPTRDVVVAV